MFQSAKHETDSKHMLKDLCLRLKFTNNGDYITFNKKFYYLLPPPPKHTMILFRIHFVTTCMPDHTVSWSENKYYLASF